VIVAVELIAGLLLITAGGEALVRGAGRVAKLLGVPAVMVALTLVAFGTSCPELAVNVTASMRDATDLALGNIIGSNIANLLLVLGLASVVRPLAVHLDLIKRESPFLLSLHLLLVVLILDGRLDRWDGLILVVVGLFYLGFLIRAARRAKLAEEEPTPPAKKGAIGLQAGLAIAGMAMLLLGAHWFVAGALELVGILGLSERVVGLTVAAIGTSLPEIGASVVASLRRHADLAIGNAIGSCIFNLVFVLGLTTAIRPMPVALATADGVGIDLAVATAASALLIPILWTSRRIVRFEGIAMLTGYGVYVAYLVLNR